MQTDAQQMPVPSDPAWCLTESGLNFGQVEHYESIFTLCNGYMGVRGSVATSPQLGKPGVYVAGVYDRIAGFQHEIVNLPLWLELGLWVDGFPVDLRKGVLLEYERTLDMRQGILFTHIVWRDAAMHTTRFELARLVHRSDRHTALQWGTITPLDYSANVRVRSVLDAWSIKYGSPEETPRLTGHVCHDEEAAGILLSADTRETGIRTVLASSLEIAGATGRATDVSDDRIAEVVTAPMQAGQPVSFCKRVAVFTSRDGGDPEAQARTHLAELRITAPAAIVATHTAAWAKGWADADIRIVGDERAQKAMRFDLFHLQTLPNPEDSTVSIGAKGLHGSGYHGWVYWDTEIYLLPFYIYTAPRAARTLLEYRYRMLDDARANAHDAQREGAYYPWNSTLIGRERRAPGWQEHVGSDIAYGIDLYVRGTGDRTFLHEAGGEIVLETARYWASRVTEDPEKGVVITGIMGPDEIHGGISNNCFTNQLAKWHFLYAASVVKELAGLAPASPVLARIGVTPDEVARWRDLAARMYLPFASELNVHEQFDGYLELPDKAIDRSLSRMQYTGPVQHSFKPTRVAQQADTVLMYWMFSECFPLDVQREGYRFYEPRCSHTSSLSRCIYCAVAAQTGLLDEAWRHFIPALETDIAEGAEMESEHGVHVAAMGGAWLAAVTGFGGLSLRDDVLTLAPRLPDAIRALSFRLKVHDIAIDLDIDHDGVHARTQGGSLAACVHGQSVTIGPDGIRVASGA